MLCFLWGMAFVPNLLVTWSSAAFIISYVVAVLSGHVNPFLPYIRVGKPSSHPQPSQAVSPQVSGRPAEIPRGTAPPSDTGTTPPESGIFGFMINFSAFLGAATMYTRYKIVEKQNQTSYFSTPVFNLVSLVLGLVGCIGMGIVANFQGGVCVCRAREGIPSRLHAQPRAPGRAPSRDPEVRTRAEMKSRTLYQWSHPGVPRGAGCPGGA
eukprot:XP_022259136.1 DNA damage-regulated autophagy modulator protein 1 isoform X8 [Canis lupus familiaris]